jgi:hypothetical protein
MAQLQKTVQQTGRVAEKRQPSSGYTAHVAQPHRTGGRVSARSVGMFVPKLTRTAFEKFGFSTVALITDWAQIVGPTLAQTTTPDRIRWPKTVGQEAVGGRAGPRAGATLHLSVEPARALDVQYKSQLIIDRINAYFGYRAVADLRIVQANVMPAAAMPPVRNVSRPPVALDPVVGTIADEGLRLALERMQQGMIERRG